MEESEKPVFLEIEPITEKNPMTRSRERFYERLGFHSNSFYYEQMPLKPGDKAIPLLIMSYGKLMAEDEFKPYKREIYELVYGVDAE